jgi:hypothetical protein
VTEKQTPHRANAAGPFYVVDGCCTACGVPESIAPEMFAFHAGSHCYVKKQPESTQELERAIQVVRTQELDCIRYRGTDPHVLRRLAEAGEAAACDYPAEGVEPVLRNVVTFAAPESSGRLLAYLDEFVEHLRTSRPSLGVRTRRRWWNRESLSIAWFENNFHRMTVRRIDKRVVIWHGGPLAISEWLHDWLRATSGPDDLRWYTRDEWEKGAAWQTRPW